jgi:hypothetical protein
MNIFLIDVVFDAIQVRVMDCFMFEGRKVMFRVWMAILILFHRHLTSLSPNDRIEMISFEINF